MGSCSVVQWGRPLMGQPVCCSVADASMRGERGYGDGCTPYAWLRSIALLPWLPGFPPQAFPITVSSLTSPQSISLQSTAALTLGSLHAPQTAAPSCRAFQRTIVPICGMYGCARTLILIPFRLPQISCFTLSLKCFSSDSDNCPNVGIGPCFSLVEGRSSPMNTPLFPPSSFILPSFAWFFIFFSSDQVLLFALSWCSAYTSISEGVFLMCLWREMYSTSTYSSTILFSGFNFGGPWSFRHTYVKSEELGMYSYSKIIGDFHSVLKCSTLH